VSTPAPIYRDTLVLCAGLLEETERGAHQSLLRRRIATGALRLLDHLSLALAGFDRRERLAAADAELQTLRSQLLLGMELEVIGESALLAFAERAEAVGRQIGGWRKKLEREA
jgi:hypothetical protein